MQFPTALPKLRNVRLVASVTACFFAFSKAVAFDRAFSEEP
jgi:hypothetical protein